MSDSESEFEPDAFALLPHPATWLDRHGADAALRAGLSPVVVQDNRGVMLPQPKQLLCRDMDTYRSHLRTAYAGEPWNKVVARFIEERNRQRERKEAGLSLSKTERLHLESLKGKLLLSVHAMLNAEAEAAEEFEKQATEYSSAAVATQALVLALRGDSRIMDDVPLLIAQEDHSAAYEGHRQSLTAALALREHRPAIILTNLCIVQLGKILTKNVLVRLSDHDEFRYDPGAASLRDLDRIAATLAHTAKLARWIVSHGITGVMRQHRKGNKGPLPKLLDAWLVQQGRWEEPRLGPQKLAKLLAGETPGRSTEATAKRVESIRRRLAEIARTHTAPVNLTI